MGYPVGMSGAMLALTLGTELRRGGGSGVVGPCVRRSGRGVDSSRAALRTAMTDLDGRTRGGIQYRVQGGGEPLLFIPGYAVSSCALPPVIAGFADEFTCISFDHRGSGASQAPMLRMTTSGMAHHALDVLDAVDLVSAHIYGISLGGMVAQGMALIAPHRVRSLVLVATTAGGSVAYPAGLWTLVSALASAKDRVPGARNARMLGAWSQAWAALTHDASGRLGELEVPTLILHGDRGILMSPANALALHRLVAHREIRFLHGAEHVFPYLHNDELGDLLRGWLNRQDAAVHDAHEVPADDRRRLVSLARTTLVFPCAVLDAQRRLLGPAAGSITSTRLDSGLIETDDSVS